MEQTPLSPRVSKTRQRIRQAAAQVFAAKGYSAATTRGIAEAAGVSELTLFRHFGTKKKLFMAVLEQYSALPGIAAALAGHITGDPQEDLLLFGFHFLSTLYDRRAAILMTLSEAERQPEVREVSANLLQQQRGMLVGYLSRQVEAGHLQDLEPSLMAQAFLGMLFAYAINQRISHDEGINSDEEIQNVVSFFVNVFLNGVGASKAEGPSFGNDG